ncbi:MAG TPA: MBL fold metallo-hydrolase [Chloroflexia bacterium]|nr:MBL fold metallo-hydrolase [Chloroflexia bacterium]
MFVKAVVWGPGQVAGYLTFDARGGSGIVIDAPPGAAKRFIEIATAEGVKIAMVINTHGHWDHIADNLALAEATGAPLCAHAWDIARMANPQMTMYNAEGFKVAPSTPDRILHDQEVLEIGSMRFEVMHTPGHTPGSICLYEAARGLLFSGDTLLKQGVGRTDVPGGNNEALNKSLRRLCMLPDATRVYPGHGSPTTIKDERWLLELALL